MENTEKKPGRNFFWPEITSPEAALKAIRTAFNFGIFLCGAMVVVSILPFFGFSLLGFGLTDVVEVVVWGFLLWGLKRKSRVCAIVLIVYYVVSKVLFMIEQPGHAASSFSWLIIVTLYFVNGARGVFRYYQLTGETPKKFRWGTVLWVVSAALVFFFVVVVSGVAENILLDLKLAPVVVLLKQNRWEEAQAKAEEILRPFSRNTTAERKKNDIRHNVNVLKLYTSAMQAFAAKQYPKAVDLLKKTAEEIRLNAPAFSLSKAQLHAADHELGEWKSTYHGDIPASSLMSVRAELGRWVEKTKIPSIMKLYCDAILITNVKMPAPGAENGQKPLE